MLRRNFLRTAAGAPALAFAQQAPPQDARVEKLTAAAKPAIAMNHLGYLPGGRKTVIYRVAEGETAPTECDLADIAPYPKSFRTKRALTLRKSDFGPCAVAYFNDVERPAMYQVTVAAERSVPFFIRADVWRRTLPDAVDYIRRQRCGVAVANVHDLCHMDDARRRDNNQHVDTTGGWHDAGDLRKWMTATMMNGLALCYLARNLGAKWNADGAGLAPLREEMAWGNRYFLKMQDTDGRVWADVAGGLNGDNSDNHWTDNQVGTTDDRYLNPAKSGRAQSMFTLLEALVAQMFRGADNAYADQCLKAAVRCWDANQRDRGPIDAAFWTMAAVELHRATKETKYRDAAIAQANALLALQQTAFIGNQKRVRGFFRAWPGNETPLVDAVYAALPAIALLEAAAAYPGEGARWRDAVKMYVDEYMAPMVSRTPYEIMPYGVFLGAPTKELYRTFEGELTYRYFMPVRKQFWWLGMTSQLESHALLLGMAAAAFGKSEYRLLAYRQLEWVLGANPFGASLMTGQGIRNPYPHSRYVGLIPGGIMNGIAGNANDEPVLDTENGFDWRTVEYWSPHNAYYIWALSVLEKA